MIFFSDPNLQKSVELDIANRGKQIKYVVSFIQPNLLHVIMSTGIHSPLEFLKYSNSPIVNTQFLVLALAMRDANLTAVFFLGNKCTSCYKCFEFPLDTALTDAGTTLPFQFHTENQVFSFVTCSGRLKNSNSLGILLESFNWKIWICVFSCIVFFLTYMILGSGHWNFIENVKTSISLVLGALGGEILASSVLDHKKCARFLLLWGFLGILFGSLYQARLTKSLTVPSKYISNLTLVDVVDRNYTVLLISDADRKLPHFEDIDEHSYKLCLRLRFCRQLLIDTILNEGRDQESLKDKGCKNPLKCEKLFGGKLHIRKFPQLIVNAKNYRFLVSQLSSCSKNVLFIHNRQEMHKVVKPKLPRIVKNYRREFIYSPLSDNLLPTPVMACFTYVSNQLVQPVLKKYIEHGLYNIWADLSSMLSFRWNTGMKEEVDLTEIIKFDEKFVSIIFIFLIAHAFSLIVLVRELFKYRVGLTAKRIYFRQTLARISEIVRINSC